MIPNGSPTEKTPIVVDTISATYFQDIEGGQYLKITTIDEGGGTYFRMETNGWDYDSIEELNVILNDFNNRIKIEE
jgi:hypothetical protein